MARPKENDDATKQGSQAPRSRSHEKTGEAYTAARAHIIKKPKPKRFPDRACPHGSRLRRARRQERRIIKARTGCTWERWVGALDYAQAKTCRIARSRARAREIQGAWLVGADRHGGLRAHQGPARASDSGGTARSRRTRAGRSRAAGPAVSRLPRRAHPGAMAARGESHGPHRHAREVDADHLAGPDVGGGGLPGAGAREEQVAIQHEKLADRAAQVRMKQYWAERLDALGQVLVA